MLKNWMRGIAGLMLGLTGFGQALAQTVTVVNIPEFLQGYYSLDMVNAIAGSPIGNTSLTDAADNIQLYVNPLGTLCTRASNSSTIQVLSSNPVLQGGPFGVVQWDVPSSGLRFTLNISANSFGGFEISSLSGTTFGRLEGSAPQFDNGSCGTPPLATSAANTFFNLAEGVYPTLFPATAFTFNQIGSGFDVFRYYQASEIYLAIRDNVVYARGGDFGDDLVTLGKLSDLIDDINNMAVPNRIPSFFQGTFQLALGDTQPFSPLEDGTQLNFVVTGTGQLCVGELQLGFPVISGNTAIWNHTNGNLRYTVDLTRDDDPATVDAEFPVGEFSFQSLAGSTYGLFSGNKTSLSTECADAAGEDPDLEDINTLFSLLEEQYPSVFPSGPQTYNQKADGFTYRYYFASQVFVAVQGGVVYLNGGEFGTQDEPVAFGTLASVLSQLNETPTSASVPTDVAGTYAMSFSAATSFSPFTDGTTAQVVVDATGKLCVDGVALGAAAAKTSTPSLAYWENADAGLSISLNLATLTTTDLSLQVGSLNGLNYSTLSGSRTSLATSCGGSVVTTDIAAANQLFGLAEQYYGTLFPASVLSFNQAEGNTVRRYYPSTGMTLSITGESVSVKGGAYGSDLVPVGGLSALITQIAASHAPVYDLRVTGTGQVVIANTIINRKVDFKRNGVSRPDATDTTAMEALVRSSMSDILRDIDSIALSNITEATTTMSFTATVVSDTVNVSSITERDYTLSFVLTRR